MAAAMPIHDTNGSSGFTFVAAGFEYSNGHFSGETLPGCFMCIPEQSGLGEHNFGSAVHAFKIEKNARQIKNQIQHDNMGENREVSDPAPATLFLLGTGLIGLVAFRRKRRIWPEKETLPPPKRAVQDDS